MTLIPYIHLMTWMSSKISQLALARIQFNSVVIIIISSSCNTSPIPPSCHGGDNDDNKLQYRAKFSPSLGHGLGHITNGGLGHQTFAVHHVRYTPTTFLRLFLKSICKVGSARAVCQLGCTTSVSASVRHPRRVLFVLSWHAACHGIKEHHKNIVMFA